MNRISFIHSTDKRKFLMLVVMVLFAFFSACSGEQSENRGNKPVPPLKEPLIKANRQLVGFEDEQIASFIDRYGWDMEQTPNGLRYMIYQTGNGRMAFQGLKASIEYEAGLLNGKVCYTSDSLGLKVFEIGSAEVEKGLNEGILLMREGDRAKFIIPSHLAFGLLGDGNCIPSKATLVYDVKLLSLSDN